MIINAIKRMAALYTGSSKVKVFDAVEKDDDGVSVKIGKKTSKVANMVKISMTETLFIIEYTNDDLYAKIQVLHGKNNLKTNEKFSVVIPFAKLIKACALSGNADIHFRDTKNKLVIKMDKFADKIAKSNEFFIHYDINAESKKVCDTDVETLRNCLILHASGGNKISSMKNKSEKNKSESVMPVLDNVALFHNGEALIGATSISDGGVSMGKYKLETDYDPFLIPLPYCPSILKFFGDNEPVSVFRVGGRMGMQGDGFQLIIPQGSGTFPKLESITKKDWTDVLVNMKKSEFIKYLSHLMTAYDDDSHVVANVVIVSHRGVDNIALSSIGELSETTIVTEQEKLTGENFIMTISLPIFIKLLKSMKGSTISLSSEIVDRVGIMNKITCDDHLYFLSGIRGNSTLSHIEAVLQQENDNYDDVADEQPVPIDAEPEQPDSRTSVPFREELSANEIPF